MFLWFWGILKAFLRKSRKNPAGSRNRTPAGVTGCGSICGNPAPAPAPAVIAQLPLPLPQIFHCFAGVIFNPYLCPNVDFFWKILYFLDKILWESHLKTKNFLLAVPIGIASATWLMISRKKSFEVIPLNGGGKMKAVFLFWHRLLNALWSFQRQVYQANNYSAWLVMFTITEGQIWALRMLKSLFSSIKLFLRSRSFKFIDIFLFLNKFLQ